MKQNFRTNFFEFGDKKLINNICKEHNVKVTSNGGKVALIATDINELINSIKRSFNENCKIVIKNDVVFVNL
jgi:hypothetical protein